jgi:hypothetical protein
MKKKEKLDIDSDVLYDWVSGDIGEGTISITTTTGDSTGIYKYPNAIIPSISYPTISNVQGVWSTTYPPTYEEEIKELKATIKKLKFFLLAEETNSAVLEDRIKKIEKALTKKGVLLENDSSEKKT